MFEKTKINGKEAGDGHFQKRLITGWRPIFKKSDYNCYIEITSNLPEWENLVLPPERHSCRPPWWWRSLRGELPECPRGRIPQPFQTSSAERKINTWYVKSFFRMGHSQPFSFIFGLFKQTFQFLQQNNVKNVHPVYGARIRTHNLWHMSFLP